MSISVDDLLKPPLAIEVLRRRKNYSQRGLADRVEGLTQTRLSLIENGRDKPPVELLRKIRVALGRPEGIEPEDLLKCWDDIIRRSS